MVTETSEPSQTQQSLLQDGKTFQVVSFGLGKEEYGVNIMMVQEIILLGTITQVPEVADYILGVINLRGNVIPIVNLRKRFGLPEQESTDDTRIVVINLEGRTVGIIVDQVSEVLRISQEQISAAPPSLCTMGREYILGLAKLSSKLLILLDMERILGNDESVDTTQKTTEPV